MGRGPRGCQRYNDFVWVFLTRFPVTMGVYTVQEFLQFYSATRSACWSCSAGDGRHTPEVAVSFFLITLLVGALVGAHSPRGCCLTSSGRVDGLYLGTLQGLVALILIPFHDFTLAVMLGVVLGSASVRIKASIGRWPAMCCRRKITPRIWVLARRTGVAADRSRRRSPVFS